MFCTEPPNETVEKPLVRKMFIKISHNRLKNCRNVAKMLCGTPKTSHFSAFLSHFSKIIFEKRLIRQSQRLALAAWCENQPTKRKNAFAWIGFFARPTTKSAARIVRRFW